jgi:D-lactate dehydrogenase
MKVVAYSVRNYEKELIAKANQKKHDITLISNALNFETAIYAEGKEAVVVFNNDDLSEPVINKLGALGIRYIATRSVGTDHIDRDAAAKQHIKIANVPSYSPEAIAEYAVTLALALSRKLILTADQSRVFDFRIDQHIGFNFSGKAVGIIGLGETGTSAANIFKGLGCKVLGYDIKSKRIPGVIMVDEVNKLYAESDIISLHVPLTDDTRYMINKHSLSKMKSGIMLINTSRGAVIKTTDVINALDQEKIGYLGMDVYEFEKGLFFYDHQNDKIKDPLLEKLISYPNVIISPHQAFLTIEALQEIASKTIANLDNWQKNNCAGNACGCAVKCNSEQKDKTQFAIQPVI